MGLARCWRYHSGAPCCPASSFLSSPPAGSHGDLCRQAHPARIVRRVLPQQVIRDREQLSRQLDAHRQGGSMATDCIAQVSFIRQASGDRGRGVCRGAGALIPGLLAVPRQSVPSPAHAGGLEPGCRRSGAPPRAPRGPLPRRRPCANACSRSPRGSSGPSAASSCMSRQASHGSRPGGSAHAVGATP